jgi:hypothetical protein
MTSKRSNRKATTPQNASSIVEQQGLDRRPGSARINVPTTVRVEAGWNRQDRNAAGINRPRVTDHPLDATRADKAAALHTRLGVSITDALLGAVLADLSGPHTALTSDMRDLKRIAAHPRRAPGLLGCNPTV